MLHDLGVQHVFGLGLVRTVNVDLRLDDRNQPGRNDLFADFKLLVNDGLDALCIGLVDHRAHLGAEHAVFVGFLEQRVQVGNGFHQLNTVFFASQALVDLEEWRDVLDIPQVGRRGLSLDLAIHRHLEQNGAENAVAAERRARDNARTHLVHDVEHLVFAGPGIFADAVEPQGFWRAAAALVKGCDESGGGFYFIQLVVEIAHGHSLYWGGRNNEGGIVQQAGRIGCNRPTNQAPIVNGRRWAKSRRLGHNRAVKRTAARLVRHALESIGVEYTFGIPGVHNIELYDELKASESILPVLVTHEVGAAFMADAISRIGDSIGVLAIVPAAGITHALSGVGEAYLDGVPMLVISGGIRTDMDKTFQLHDVDQQAILRPLTKATFRIESHADAIPVIYEAYRTATAGEPGPVFVELPANLQLLTGEVDEMPAYEDTIERPAVDAGAVKTAVEVLEAAERPGIFVGWGARHVADDIARIAEYLGAPVATTLQGLAAFPADHALHAGMTFGPSAVPSAENAFRNCDAMLAVGTRFAEICTGSYGAVPPDNLVHIDINPDALNANYPARVAICADARDAVPALADALSAKGNPRDNAPMAQQIAGDKAAYRNEWRDHDSGERVNPCLLFDALRAQLDDDAIIIADDGNHTFLTAELMPINSGGQFFSPTDFNCMGYCVPATIAAKLARPGNQVVGVVGDGAFLMTGMESVTAASNGLGIVWFVFNDGELAQIAQAQEVPYQRRTCTTIGALDFEAFAKATGCAYVGIHDNGDIDAGIESALQAAAANRPVIVDVRIDYSKKTRFTIGTLQTNLERFDTRTKARMIGRALYRKVFGA